MTQSPDGRDRTARTRVSWQPSLGAWCEGAGTRFRVWAPARQHVDVVLEASGTCHPLRKGGDGTFSGLVTGVRAGDHYRYRLDGEGLYPDPASRFQPEGVHGPSEVVDPRRFTWTDSAWPGVPLADVVLYELHVGTFTPAGTFAALSERLAYLRDLGVTAVELMPVADFPGERNWGYDGVDLFAPARCYGRPDDLRRFVDQAHSLGLAVVLDVVYNHLGPDGAYLGTFSPYYFSERHRTPWGAAINLDGAHSAMVRAFFIENALHWVHEYHVDGLRLDATHALIDESPRHFLAELADRVHASVSSGTPVLLIAEDHRNLAHMVRPEAEGGWSLDAVWADDFHHQVRCGLAGDQDGYYADFTGSVNDLATTVRQGWFYCGQHSAHLGGPRGTTPSGLSPRQFVVCLQNHDQVGNRAFGERLHHQIDLAAYRAASVLLLCIPETPLLFMGQEWAASAPFLYFTDHNPELGKLVTEGRRREFKGFAAFADPQVRERIPDPQAELTFLESRLNWPEAAHEPQASALRFYRALLSLRRTESALRAADWNAFAVAPVGANALVLHWFAAHAPAFFVAIQLRDAGAVDLNEGIRVDARQPLPTRWHQLLSTEDPQFAPDPAPVQTDLSGVLPRFRFARPGAVVGRYAPI